MIIFLIVIYLFKIEAYEYGYVVGIFYRINESLQCAGGAVSSQVVLTSCSCVGVYRKTNGNFFDFKPFDGDKFFIASVLADNQTYDVDKLIIHGHCKPSRYDEDLYVYDLGAWKIKKRFRSFFFMDVFKSKVITLQQLTESKAKCFIFVNEDPKTWSFSKFELNISDPINCGKRHCYFNSREKTKVVCTDLLAKDVREGTVCSNYVYESVETTPGSPVVCDESVWGVVSSNRKSSVLWTRIDWENNVDFLHTLNGSLFNFSRSHHHFSNVFDTFLLLLAIKYLV